MHGQVNALRQMHGRTDRQTHTYTDAWTDGHTYADAWKDGHRTVHGQTNTYTDSYICTHTYKDADYYYVHIYRIRNPTSKLYRLYHGTVSLLCNKNPSSFLYV